MVKVCTKFQRNRIIGRRVIHDLTNFCRPILKGAPNLRTVLRDAWAELYQIWVGRRVHRFVSDFRYLDPLRNAGGSSKASAVENWGQISHPPL